MFSKVIVPLDGSEISELALPCAEELAGILNSEIQLVYVCETREKEYRHMHQVYIEEIAEQMKEHIKDYGAGGPAEQIKTGVLDGEPAAEITGYAERNNIGHLCYIPDDEYFGEQWSLHNVGQTGGTPDVDINAPEAWDIETGNEDVIIAMVDTGVDYTHPDLMNNIWINSGEDVNENGIVDPEDFNSIDDDDNGYVDDLRGWNFGYNNSCNKSTCKSKKA